MHVVVPVLLENFPGIQLVQVEIPSVFVYVPTGHDMQADLAAFVYLPAAQFSQFVDPRLAENFPGEQALQGWSPVAELYPFMHLQSVSELLAAEDEVY